MRTFLFYVGYLYYLLLLKTVRIKLNGFNEIQAVWKSGRNAVFCCPHNSILACFVGVDKQERPHVALVASLSKDGELVSKLLLKRRYEMIRGSSSRGGRKALLEMQRAGEQGKSLGIAFDGPKGPPLIPKRGLVGCARVVNGPLFLIHAHSTRGRIFGYPRAMRVNSWDKMLIPLPFSEIEVFFEKLPEKDEINLSSDEHYEFFILNLVQKRSEEVFQKLYLK
ncbi:lysophospholipid acyltransferase family protein [Fluviispira multicolorata]|uniref:DUF374 domain-containing protein n=1 Tax=Fluviispira multicolorata TaxID=2654512 RepID=A0A833JFC4_9BACT|nr:DUF374 domain-containing protein [Fluviispira multicolorata]KAB8033230.1 DUF374 domain-containing protein [Fluviispira multicolorata]